MKKISNKAQFSINTNVELYGFDAKFVPTFEEYKKLKEKDELKKHIIYEQHGSNLVVNQGLNFIRDVMIASTTGSITHTQPGTSSTAVAASDTALGGAIGSRLAAADRYSGGTGIINIDTFYTAGDNNGSWAEVGAFTASSGGSMIARKILSSTFTKATTNTALLAWTFTMTSS